jgi:Domain of unknown function (DUF1824)
MMTPQQAQDTLRDARDLGVTATQEQRGALREALQTLSQKSSYQIFGVCAADWAEGITALRSYAREFDQEFSETLEQQMPHVDGAVYLKFNPRTQRCHIDSYTGSYRGVLVSFQSDFADGYSDTHGHFPLDLYA